jgi:hypothetical protein
MEKYPKGFSPKLRLINHIEKKEFSDKLRNHQRSFRKIWDYSLMSKNIPIMTREIVNSIKGIVAQDDYLFDLVLSI